MKRNLKGDLFVQLQYLKTKRRKAIKPDLIMKEWCGQGYDISQKTGCTATFILRKPHDPEGLKEYFNKDTIAYYAERSIIAKPSWVKAKAKPASKAMTRPKPKKAKAQA